MMKVVIFLIAIVGAVYYHFDRYLFFFGKNDLPHYNLLPFNVQPEDRPKFEGGFALRDSYGFSIAAKGNEYPLNGSTIVISKVVDYTYDKKNLSVTVSDSNSNQYRLQFYPNKDSSQIIPVIYHFKKMRNYNLGKIISIVNNDAYINNLDLKRNYSLLLLVILATVLIILIFKRRPSSKIQN